MDIEKIIVAARSWITGLISPYVFTYITDGGTYVIATDLSWTDSGKPRDLVAILPIALQADTRVVPLYIGVNPDLVVALREALDD